ncbi:MAG TPA: ATP-binding protein [Acidimicrobiales bacterium]|jgi:anti-sigma regulatory factor (Ser/Thr protein kinase)|nr:ATP-binding protein [Acidimicrobiales bacterium]
MNSQRPVQLTAPAERSSVRLARLVASGVGAEAGLSIDDTEDLRIAVSELVALLVDGVEDPGQSILVTYLSAPGEVTVEGQGEAGPPASDREASRVPGSSESDTPPAVDDLALEILRVVVDVHAFEADEAGRRFRVVKRARSA